jgi:hypothetical protein
MSGPFDVFAKKIKKKERKKETIACGVSQV